MSTRVDLLLARAGISYRQLDYWCRCGYINERFQRRNGEAVEAGKSGYRRDLDADEEQVLLRMARLVNAGMQPDVAARLARSVVVVDGTGYMHLGPGLLLKTTEASR